ncbi:MAG TPA: trypsin-like peptidase domain-containing protein [Stellaceae bacterium]|nr:trypsin-like peptidase domain-containing protein [Stellaceae bacterium]
MAGRIVIHHLSGSKINRVDQFPFESSLELTIGRDPNATLHFDALEDDVVSRRHAMIKAEPGDPPHCTLSDLGSRNGTLLNGQIIRGEEELLPGDTIELGSGGPKFTFDIEPRPANFVSRTRIVGTEAQAATRIVEAPGPKMGRGAGEPPLPITTMLPEEPIVNPGVGRNTVMRMLSEQRQATNRIGLYVIAAILAVIAIVGGVGYYEYQQTTAQQTARLQAQAAHIQKAVALQTQQLKTQIDQTKQQLGLSPQQIVEKYGNAVVLIHMHWQLYDRETGKPLFHKVFYAKQNDGSTYRLPAYVFIQGKLYRWLTTDDNNHSNFEIGANGTGTGFVITDQGLIVTNKHVAAGWMINYNQFSFYENGQAVIFALQDKLLPPRQFAMLERQKKPSNFSGEPALLHDIVSWQPEDGGPVFRSDQPVMIGNNTHAFEGRNEQLSVQFPGSRIGADARLVRASTDADAALIKIDPTQTLMTAPLAPGDDAAVGEPVTVLGYPAFSIKDGVIVETEENGEFRKQVKEVPEPTVIPGSISKIGQAPKQMGNVTTVSQLGDVYQMTATSGPGNSGGPVFNKEGQVIGLFTYGTAREAVTYAVPIRYARDLLQEQRTQ